MQKDVIYIDVEDDITSIIGKIKASEHEIVALVPPKRTGAIQSAVNLKLVHRAAERADKRLVVISNNAALAALAGAAGIPVAKNLQSRPELAEMTALKVDDDDDIIDGAADAAASGDKDKSVDKAVDSIAAVESENGAPKDGDSKKKPTAGGKKKAIIPDFNKFRKKFFIILAAVVLLVGFGVWALVFAPRASITISAQTSQVAVNTQISASDAASTSLDDGTIKSTTKTSEAAVSKSFTATGTKDVGEKATGRVRFTASSVDAIADGTTIAAGTTITSSSGATYVTNSTATISATSTRNAISGNYASATVAVTATESGTKYNGASGSATGPSGVKTSFVDATSGGTDKTVAIVTQSDIEAATADLVSDTDKNAAKAALEKEFGSDYVIIDSSFATDTSGLSVPAVDSEADSGTATISGNVKYTLTAISNDELDTFLDAYFEQQIDGKSNQKVYSNGASSVSLTNVSLSDGTATATLTTNGKIGPKIDEDAVKEYAKGKQLGEVHEYVKKIDGVNSVDVKFSPFWVGKVPNDTNKITIQFDVDE